jgi:hypothetical protein
MTGLLKKVKNSKVHRHLATFALTHARCSCHCRRMHGLAAAAEKGKRKEENHSLMMTCGFKSFVFE